MNAEFRAKDLPRTPDIRADRSRSHKLHSHGKPRAADCSGRLAGRAGGDGRGRAGGRGVAGRDGRPVRPDTELRPAWPGLLPGQGVAAAALIFAYATARNVSMYTEARLGQLWQVLTPLLNSAVYYLIFGILFKANRGISNYTAYLVTGVFIFAFTERSIVVGSTVMRANMTLIRALHFPRACLPLAYVLVELQQLLLSMVVLFAIVLGTGEPLTWYWLLLLPALLMQATFNVGAALIMARVGAGAQDISQLVPFLLRVWRYFCGVMYSIASLPAALPEWAKNVLSFNPAAVYISLTRYAIMATYRADAPGAKPYDAARCAIFNAKKIPSLQAYCHPDIAVSELWLAGV